MTKYKGIIRLKEKPYQTIKWFTEHFDKEIGAIGIGEVIDGEVVVEKLVFPQQVVNSAHVHFRPEDWASIVKELSEEELEKVIFYWHKHPNGMVGASQGDEDDTFDVFMEPDSGREMFAFMQTANNTVGNGFKYEGRIELRKPLWASITDVEMVTDKDDKIEKSCLKIIEKCVKEGTASASDQPGFNKTEVITPPIATPTITQFSYENFIAGKFRILCYSCGGYFKTMSRYEYNKGSTEGYYCKECTEAKVGTGQKPPNLEETVTEDSAAAFEVTIESGQVKLKHSEFLGDWIDEIVTNPEIDDLIAKKSTIAGDITVRNFQPKKKQITVLYEKLKAIENELCGLGENGIVPDETPGRGSYMTNSMNAFYGVQ